MVADKPERVADYFAVIGLDPDVIPLQDDFREGNIDPRTSPRGPSVSMEEVFSTRYKAAVLDRLPAEDYPDTILPPQVAMFALPEGLTVKKACPLPTAYIVVFTSNEGRRMYGSVLTFHEELTEEQQRKMSNEAPQKGADKLWIPKCLCLLSHWPFHDPFREFLKQLYRISLTASRTPIERIIANLLYEVPLPPRGRVKVQYSIADKTIELSRTPANELPMPRVPLDVLFLLLDRANALQVITCVLLEQKMLFYSDSVSLLTTVAESILALIFPFRWEHVYIPVLPLQLLEFVHAPTPFIMGVHPGSLKNRQTFLGSSCPDDVVVVNLDHNTVRLPARKLPPLPPKPRKKLLEQLEEHLAPVNSARSRRRLANIDLAFPMAPTPEESQSPDHLQDQLAPALAFQVQYAFFRFLLSVLQRYREFLVMPTADDPHPQQLFKATAFLHACARDSRPFLEGFVETAMFSGFIEMRAYSSGSEHDHVLFDESLDAKANRSALRFSRRPTPFLDDRRHAVKSTHVAATPNEQGLPPGKVYVYSTFPKLDAALLCEAREVRSLVTGELLVRGTKADGLAPLNHGLTRMPSLSRFTSPPSCTPQQKSRASKDKHRMAMMREHIYSLWFLLHVVVTGERGDGEEAQWLGIEEEFAVALQVLAKMKAEKLAPDQACYRALIETAGRASCPDTAMWGLPALAAGDLESVLHTCWRCRRGCRAVLRVCSQGRRASAAVLMELLACGSRQLVEAMRSSGLAPDQQVYSSLVKAVAKSQASVAPSPHGAMSAGNSFPLLSAPLSATASPDDHAAPRRSPTPPVTENAQVPMPPTVVAVPSPGKQPWVPNSHFGEDLASPEKPTVVAAPIKKSPPVPPRKPTFLAAARARRNSHPSSLSSSDQSVEKDAASAANAGRSQSADTDAASPPWRVPARRSRSLERTVIAAPAPAMAAQQEAVAGRTEVAGGQDRGSDDGEHAPSRPPRSSPPRSVRRVLPHAAGEAERRRGHAEKESEDRREASEKAQPEEGGHTRAEEEGGSAEQAASRAVPDEGCGAQREMQKGTGEDAAGKEALEEEAPEEDSEQATEDARRGRGGSGDGEKEGAERSRDGSREDAKDGGEEWDPSAGADEWSSAEADASVLSSSEEDKVGLDSDSSLDDGADLPLPLEGDGRMSTCLAPSKAALREIVDGGKWEVPGAGEEADGGIASDRSGRSLEPIRRLSSPIPAAADLDSSEQSRRPSDQVLSPGLLEESAGEAHAPSHPSAAASPPPALPLRQAPADSGREAHRQPQDSPLPHAPAPPPSPDGTAPSPDAEEPIRRCSPIATTPPAQADERPSKRAAVPPLELPRVGGAGAGYSTGAVRDLGPRDEEAWKRVELEVRDECPSCQKMLFESDVLSSWHLDEHDYTTACVHCTKKFVARFRVRKRGDEHDREAAGAEESFECLSPLVVKKELTSLMRSIDEPEEVERMRAAGHDGLTAGVAREEGFACYLRGRQPSIFWNLVWHFLLCKLPLHLLLRSEVVVVSSGPAASPGVSGRKAKPAGGSIRDLLRSSPRTPSV